jgi:acetylornithine/N-succinyldiaminopimelate aminotransferase
MDLDEVKNIDRNCYMNVFGERINVKFEYGKGIFLYDASGKEYMDLLGGIAVNVLGHAHPALVGAICAQAGKIIHTSSLYYIEPQAKLAKLLCSFSCADRVFFCNSGAEANEGAIKLTRAHFKKIGKPDRYEIITLKDSFHGRTMATLSATGQDKFHKKFLPLNDGFRYVEKDSIEDLKNTVTDKTCAVMLELVQGESGIRPLDKKYVQEVKDLCEEKGLLLIFDEIQTGMGRTGTMFGYQRYGVEPDIFTLAKALGGGVPIGALLAKGFVAEAFEPGDHGSTFGGNYLACAAGISVMETIISEGLLDNCKDVGCYAMPQLRTVSGRIGDVRGMGLMIGIEFTDRIAADIKNRLLDKGYLVGSVGQKIIRIMPPLIIQKKHIDSFVSALRQTLEDIYTCS